MAASTGMIEPFEAGPGARGRRPQDRLVRHVELRLRHPLLARIQDLHQHQLDDRRPQGVRRRIVRRFHRRRLHHPAEFVRARAHRRVSFAFRATCWSFAWEKVRMHDASTAIRGLRLSTARARRSRTWRAASRSGEMFFGYSIGEHGRLIVSLLDAPRYIGRDALLEVELDNGETVQATPDHDFMLRDGRMVPASTLRPGQSLMPLYRDLRRGYEMVYQPGTGFLYPTHRLADDWNLRARNLCRTSLERTGITSISIAGTIARRTSSACRLASIFACTTGRASVMASTRWRTVRPSATRWPAYPGIPSGPSASR